MLRIRYRIALTFSISLTALLVVYAIALLLVAQQQMVSELDQRLQFEAYVTGDLIRLEPNDVHAKLQARDVIETEEPETPELTIDLEVRAAEGDIIYRRREDSRRAFLSNVAFDRHESDVSTHAVNGAPIRVRQLTFTDKGHTWFVRTAADERAASRGLVALRQAIFIGTPLVLVVGVLLSYGLAGQALAPLTRIATQARTISATNLDARIPPRSVDDELGKLAGSFNDLMDRLQNAFDELRRFTSDASHELRTPLTVIRAMGESVLSSQSSQEAYRDTIGQMLEEADRLTRLTDDLLVLARGDVAGWSLQISDIDVGEVVESICGQMRVLAEEHNQTLSVHRSGTLRVDSDVNLLRLILMNAVHNAVKFTPDGGSIEVRTAADEAAIVIDVEDSGPGIPERDREKVFDRFFRVDTARSGPARGFGLGLSIARWAASELGATLTATQSELGGAQIRLRVPPRRADK